MGGHSSEKTFRTCEKLNLNTFIWESFPSLIQTRWACAACVVDNSIYCFGGNSGGRNWQSLDKCERYDSTKKEWVEIASMNHERTEISCAANERYIYVVGGQMRIQNLSSVSLHEMEIYDIDQDTWTLVNIDEFAVTAPHLAFIGNELYVMGGRNEQGKEHELVWIYDTNYKNWKKGVECLSRRAASAICYVPLKIE